MADGNSIVLDSLPLLPSGDVLAHLPSMEDALGPRLSLMGTRNILNIQPTSLGDQIDSSPSVNLTSRNVISTLAPTDIPRGALPLSFIFDGPIAAVGGPGLGNRLGPSLLSQDNQFKDSILLEAKSSRVDSQLLALYDGTIRGGVGASRSFVSTNASLTRASDLREYLLLDNGGENVVVRITTHNTEASLLALEAFGFQASGVRPDLNFIEGSIPIENLATLESLDIPGLMGIVPIYQPQTSVGSVTSQADFVHEVNRVRAALPNGFDGTGITIAVLSDSFADIAGGLAADIASGDLPGAGNPLGNTTPVTVLQDFVGGIDEGRAMLQLIHDLAPGATLAFSSAFFGEVDFGDQILALADPTGIVDADIIVDDIFYFEEPRFQDGVIAQAIDSVVTNNGAAYFSSAGNLEDQAYESANFAPAADTFFAGQFHDFDPGLGVDTRQSITLGPNQAITFVLQWDDPFFSAGNVDTDLDIFLFGGGTNTLVAGSARDNIAFDLPSEIFSFTNPNAFATQFDVAITLSAGPAPGQITYYNPGRNSNGPITFNEFGTNSPTITPHSAATNARSVGAVPYFDQETPEGFTSLGPTTILFEPDGTPLAAPEIRATPDFAAIDGTDTTFFGSDADGNGFPNFFGTSAAAPHAAAIAALVLEANPTFTPEQIYDRLESTAIDIGAPGFDNLSGDGLINAYDAIFGDVVPDVLLFSEDFEDGDLPIAFETNSNVAGRIQVTADNNPIGTRHVTLDSSVGLAASSLNELILHLDTTNFTDIQLSFDEREFVDEDNPLPDLADGNVDFTGSFDGDGVALSVDGTNWYTLISLTGSNSTALYQTQTFNLSTFAANNNITLGSDVQIKFQQFDNSPIAPVFTDGIAFDNITVTGTQLLNGTGGRDSLIGLATSDVITGGLGRDIITGNGSNDLFVYNDFDDRVDLLTDFTTFNIPSEADQINLTNVLASLGFNGSGFNEAVADGFLRVLDGGGSVDLIQLDPDGPGARGFRTYIQVINSNDNFANLNNPANFIIEQVIPPL